MITQLLSNLSSAATNRHVSVSVVVGLVCEAGKIWIPQYEHQFDLTQKLAYGYAAVAAANSGPKPNDDKKP